uniref:Uncharacterized protein n=1 Tax=viral metagenome TaxID=1070528 RepID=A0A6C0HL57_9ZZZZ
MNPPKFLTKGFGGSSICTGIAFSSGDSLTTGLSGGPANMLIPIML